MIMNFIHVHVASKNQVFKVLLLLRFPSTKYDTKYDTKYSLSQVRDLWDISGLRGHARTTTVTDEVTSVRRRETTIPTGSPPYKAPTTLGIIIIFISLRWGPALMAKFNCINIKL